MNAPDMAEVVPRLERCAHTSGEYWSIPASADLRAVLSALAQAQACIAAQDVQVNEFRAQVASDAATITRQQVRIADLEGLLCATHAPLSVAALELHSAAARERNERRAGWLLGASIAADDAAAAVTAAALSPNPTEGESR